MKKIIIGLLGALMLSACSNETPQDQENISLKATAEVQRYCPSEELRELALQANADLRQKYNLLEQNTKDYIQKNKFNKVLVDGSIEIPVIVNVLYKTNAENVSDARIAEQIAVLNQDYSATNTDAYKIPSEFSAIAAGDTKIKFRLVKINRKQTNKTSWSPNDYMKKTSQGGLDATSPNNYLNLWVVGKMSYQGKTILGYAAFPEYAGLWNDGVVIAAPYFGKTGASAPYNLGRTATHEVGHYLNLKHIWGDANCGNDEVEDTPTQPTANYGTPSYPLYKSCGGTSRSTMFMNYMDYVDDKAMFMFSQGQKDRANSVLTVNGARAGLRTL